MNPPVPPTTPPPPAPGPKAPPVSTQGLFRGRPYGPVHVFTVVFTGAADEAHELWVPDQAFWELGMLIIKGTAAADYMLCDTNPNIIIGMVDVNGIGYNKFDPGLASIRSQSPIGAKLLIRDIAGVASTVKGVALGWEVSREGFYRGPV
jgi:hypothetical protein